MVPTYGPNNVLLTNLQYGTCSAANSATIVENSCLGQRNCTISAGDPPLSSPIYIYPVILPLIMLTLCRSPSYSNPYIPFILPLIIFSPCVSPSYSYFSLKKKKRQLIVRGRSLRGHRQAPQCRRAVFVALERSYGTTHRKTYLASHLLCHRHLTSINSTYPPTFLETFFLSFLRAQCNSH